MVCTSLAEGKIKELTKLKAPRGLYSEKTSPAESPPIIKSPPPVLRERQIVESSSLVSVLFREAISHPYISFFHLLVNSFSVTSFRTFLKTPPHTPIILVGGIDGRGGINIASAKKNQLISSQ